MVSSVNKSPIIEGQPVMAFLHPALSYISNCKYETNCEDSFFIHSSIRHFF